MQSRKKKKPATPMRPKMANPYAPTAENMKGTAILTIKLPAQLVITAMERPLSEHVSEM